VSCCKSCAKGAPCAPDHAIGLGGGGAFPLAAGGGRQLGFAGTVGGLYGYHSPKNTHPGRTGGATLGAPIPAIHLCGMLPDGYAGNVAKRACTLTLAGMDLAEVCAAPPQIILDTFAAFGLDLAGACETLIRRHMPAQEQPHAAAPPAVAPPAPDPVAPPAAPPAMVEQALSDLDVMALVNGIMNTPGATWAAVFSPANVGGQRLTVETLAGPVDLWIFGYGVTWDQALQRLDALPLNGRRTFALGGLYPAGIGILGSIFEAGPEGWRPVGLGTGDYIDAAGEDWSELREIAFEESDAPPAPAPDEGGGILPLIAAAGLASLVL